MLSPWRVLILLVAPFRSITLAHTQQAGANEQDTRIIAIARAFSSEVDTSSRKENATWQ